MRDKKSTSRGESSSSYVREESANVYRIAETTVARVAGLGSLILALRRHLAKESCISESKTYVQVREVLGRVRDSQLAQTSGSYIPRCLFRVLRIFEKRTPENVGNAFQLCMRTVCHDLNSQTV
jgi:hypothetical protein